MRLDTDSNAHVLDFTFKDHSVIVLFSYKTPVAAKINGKCFKTSEKFSKTTSAHINKFIGSSAVQEKSQDYFDRLMDNLA